MLKRVGSNLKTLPLRHLGGGALSGLRVNFTGSERYNYNIGEGITNSQAGLPYGHLAPSAWILPHKAGALSSYKEARISFSPAPLNVAEGVNVTGATSFSFTVNGNASSVASLIGTTEVVFAGSGSLSAPFNMTGTSNFVFTPSASLSGQASIFGSTTFAFSGALTTYAVANLIATPISTALTPESISSAVWSASAASNNVAGTLGEKLNDAGSAGNPWAAALTSNNSPGTFGALVQKLVTVAKFLALK